MIIWTSINCPTVICLPTICYFSREKPLVKPTAPGSLFIIFAFGIYFPLYLFLDLLNQKYKNNLLQFIYFLRSIYPIYHFLPHVICPLEASYPKGIDNPLTRRVASICYLCAGVVYVVWGGSPTSSITLVTSLREIPTVTILHHPFVFGEISM